MKIYPTNMRFCDYVWKRQIKKGVVKPETQQRLISVKEHSLLYGFVNKTLNGIQRIDEHRKFILQESFELTPQKLIKTTDIEFKNLTPTRRPLKVFRGISYAEHMTPQKTKMYNKAISLKKGDKIRMAEYAYSSEDKNYANMFSSSKNGINYTIIVPQGARVSRISVSKNGIYDEVVFPRSSEFECTEHSIDKNGNHNILLRYIPPQEPWRKFNNQNKL